MTFWIISSALALVVAATLILVLLRSHGSGEPAAAYDLRVYRDQLKDVDRDLARGVIAPADAERIRTEVSRRILAADTQSHDDSGRQDDQARGLSRGVAVLVGAGVIAGSLALYTSLGAPGYGDLPQALRIETAGLARDTRPGQAEAEAGLPPLPPLQEVGADYMALVEKLRATVKLRPDDLQGQQLLARNEAALGNFTAAHEAQAEVLRLKGDAAETGDFVELADLLVMAAGGYVSPEAETALRTVLQRDPRNGPARYYWGLMMAQTGRPDTAFQIWRALLDEGPADAPWIAPVRAQIEEMAMRAGVNYSLPPLEQAAPGPSQADVAAAADMSEEDRQQMVRGMVDGLSERLATSGGSPREWAQLIGALAVLGDLDQARAVLGNAREVFQGNAAALEEIENAARQAGLAQ